jgi:hypothetical protein
MKNKWIIVPVLALCAFAACSKKDSGDNTPPAPTVDSSKCLLTEVKYDYIQNAPYYNDNINFTYDSLRRLTLRQAGGFYYTYSYESAKVTVRMYVNSIADSNLNNRYVYSLDANGRITSHLKYYYFRPKSENDYRGQDSTAYQYDAEGYIIDLKTYGSSGVTGETKYTYLNGNLTQLEKIYYTGGGVKDGSDIMAYTYDNTPSVPEAEYLYQVNEYRLFKTGKPNKNNIISVQCNLDSDHIPYQQDAYTSIQYAYSVKGTKVEKVTMTAGTMKGRTINSAINFSYNCK